MLAYWYLRAVFYVLLVPFLFAIDYVPALYTFVFSCTALVPAWMWQVLTIKIFINYIWWAYLKKQVKAFRWIANQRLVFFLSNYRGRFKARRRKWKWSFYNIKSWDLIRIEQGLEYLPDYESAEFWIIWKWRRPLRSYWHDQYFGSYELSYPSDDSAFDLDSDIHERSLRIIDKSLVTIIKQFVLFKNFFLFYFNKCFFNILLYRSSVWNLLRFCPAYR